MVSIAASFTLAALYILYFPPSPHLISIHSKHNQQFHPTHPHPPTPISSITMKTAIILSAVAGLVSSVSAQDYFGMLALHSASPIHYGEIHAQGQSLWIGKKTQKYCPDSVQTQGGCPKGKGTNFAGDNGGLSMGM